MPSDTTSTLQASHLVPQFSHCHEYHLSSFFPSGKLLVVIITTPSLFFISSLTGSSPFSFGIFFQLGAGIMLLKLRAESSVETSFVIFLISSSEPDIETLFIHQLGIFILHYKIN